MKKFLLPLLTVALSIGIISTSNGQKNNVRNATAMVASINQPIAIAKLLHHTATSETVKKVSINCDAYLTLIRVLQEQLKTAPPGHKAAIIRAITQARLAYLNCSRRITAVSSNLIGARAAGN